MAVNLSPIWGAGAQLFDNSGNVLTGGKIYTYAAGTTTPATTYTSSAGATANSNPIILNSAGRVPYEIWLTDTIAYKFVLKDSNDTLIATYDNLTGINSNFIVYTAQQEIQTATAGQTVFNLTTMQYQPGTNSLSVFVDGVNQYGPGAQYAYVETDTDTVTFVSGLHVGASVKFTTASPVPSGSTDAENVSYNPPFFGAVGTNVEAKLAQTVSVKDFGAVGDGVTDDTQAIQNAVDYGVANSTQIIVPSGIYNVTSAINASVLPGEDLVITGEGQEVSSFICGSHNLFTVTCSESSDPRGDKVLIAFSSFSAETTASGGNAAIEVTNINYNSGFPIKGVILQAQQLAITGTGANYWGDCIKLTHVSGFDIDSIYIQSYNNLGNGISVLGYAPAPVDGRISRVRCYNVDKAIKVYGSAEGLGVDSLVAVSCVNGVHWVSESASGVPSRTPLFTLTNSHINTATSGTNARGVYLNGVVQSLIDSTNLIYISSNDSYGVYIESSAGTLVSGGRISASVKNPQAKTNATGVYLSDDVNEIVISGTIAECAVGIRAPASSANNVQVDTSALFYSNTVNFTGTVKAVSVGDTIDLCVGNSLNLGATIGKGRTAAGASFLDFYTDATTRSGSVYHDGTHQWVRNFDTGQVFIANASGVLWRFETSGPFNPSVDNAQSIGSASLRPSVIYAATGTINTSDEREKQDIADLSETENKVAVKLKSLIRKFRFRDAVVKKEDDARIHVGVIAQEVIDAFESEGLDAHSYGIICYDQWNEQPEIFADDNTVIQKHRPAGNRYGIRYEELLAFIISAI